MSEARKTYTTPTGRLSFPAVFHPEPALEEGKDPRFAATLILDKSEDLSQLQAMIDQVILDKWGKKPPAGLKRPIRDGAEKPDTAGLGDKVWFFAARSARKPPVVDAHKVGITDEEKVYGGCYARLNVTPFAFDKGLSKGVALALNAVQIIRDGEPFASVVDVDEVFGEVDEAAGSGW
jgi:hypothetical protein